MKYIDEFRDAALGQKLLEHIRQISKHPLSLMEFCGGHSVAIMKNGLRQLLPSHIRMLSGPGCPVCVTSVTDINRAIAQAKLGNLKLAENDLKHALELEPGHPVANNEYGLLYRRTGRFSEARQLYENLLVKYPYYPLVHKNLGILCDLYLRDYKCALREYEIYSSADPEDKTIKIWITDVQRRLGK